MMFQVKFARSLDDLSHHTIFQSDLKLGEPVWCACCGRVFKYGEYREEVCGFTWIGGSAFTDDRRQYCPYAGCAGTAFDWIGWRALRSHNPGLPGEPVAGLVYSV